MIFQYELKDNSLRVMVPKELDHHSSIDLRSQTDMLLQTYHVKNLVFDFKDTEFMDSSGIGMMIGRCKNMDFTGGEVRAEHMNGRIRKIFSLAFAIWYPCSFKPLETFIMELSRKKRFNSPVINGTA